MHSIYTTVNLNNKNSFCTTSLHEFLLLHLSVNVSLIDIVTFSAFFWTSEANGCFHLEMYFWLVTMVSQQIMASVCFLTHSWRRRWQSSSEKIDGKKGCKAKKKWRLSKSFISLKACKDLTNYPVKEVTGLSKYMQITVIHKIFYNNFSLNLNLNVRTTGMWCYTFVWFFFIWSVPSTINRWSQQDNLSREIWANWLNLILTFSSWPIFIPALTLISLRNMHKVCSQFISIDKVLSLC